ncbi:thioredoxin TrxC [Pectobacterium colocasium]|uniref:thioredoxin TrxC n=1 Tax=Pectobacterium TaxID=122277 RepID=UPI0015DEC748|nr:thioredoxin TrxC [Pectobacterium sp. CFBP8739]MBA0165842.1 thioredoxin TrxC [Pectobacterium sp. CFBP8739]
MNTVCGSCQTTNRLPEARVDDHAKCGRCGETLFSGDVINATEATLDKLLQDDLPVVVDFWAPWCGPCVNFAPVFENVAQERNGKVRFIKVNTEAEPALSTRFRIRSIPTLMIFKQGQMVDILNGALPKTQFEEWLDESL